MTGVVGPVLLASVCREERCSGNHSTMHRTAPSTRNICTSQVTSALVENSCPRGLVCIPVDTQPPAVVYSRKVPLPPPFFLLHYYLLSLLIIPCQHKHALIFLILKNHLLTFHLQLLPFSAFYRKRKLLENMSPGSSPVPLLLVDALTPPNFFCLVLSSQLLGCHSPDFVSTLTGHPFSVYLA